MKAGAKRRRCGSNHGGSNSPMGAPPTVEPLPLLLRLDSGFGGSIPNSNSIDRMCQGSLLGSVRCDVGQAWQAVL
jgi:hypothetical protein